jgi:hypothetical protein
MVVQILPLRWYDTSHYSGTIASAMAVRRFRLQRSDMRQVSQRELAAYSKTYSASSEDRNAAQNSARERANE